MYTLITGTTSGIGKEFAELFAEKGYNLITVAMNEEKLKEQNIRAKMWIRCSANLLIISKKHTNLTRTIAVFA